MTVSVEDTDSGLLLAMLDKYADRYVGRGIIKLFRSPLVLSSDPLSFHLALSKEFVQVDLSRVPGDFQPSRDHVRSHGPVLLPQVLDDFLVDV